MYKVEISRPENKLLESGVSVTSLYYLLSLLVARDSTLLDSYVFLDS